MGKQGIFQEEAVSAGTGLMSVVSGFPGPPQGKSHRWKKKKAFHPPEGDETISAGASHELSHPGVSFRLGTGLTGLLQASAPAESAALRRLGSAPSLARRPLRAQSTLSQGRRVATGDLAFLQLLLPSSRPSAPSTACATARRNRSKRRSDLLLSALFWVLFAGGGGGGR